MTHVADKEDYTELHYSSYGELVMKKPLSRAEDPRRLGLTEPVFGEKLYANKQYPSQSSASIKSHAISLNSAFAVRKKHWLDHAPVILVTDTLPLGNLKEQNRFLDSVADCLQAGIRLVVFNTPSNVCTRALLPIAKNLRALTQQLDAGLIVHHQVDIALAVEADGVHLGQQDMDPATARKLLGRHQVIGLSVHNQEQAVWSLDEDIDYITAGPVFASEMLPGILPVGMPLLRWMNQHANKPWIATGGIDESTLPLLRKTGVQHIAVSRCLMRAKNPGKAARSLLASLGQGLTPPIMLAAS